MIRLCGGMGRAAVRLRVIMHSPALFSFVPFVTFVIFVIFVLVDDQGRTAIERQSRVL